MVTNRNLTSLKDVLREQSAIQVVVKAENLAYLEQEYAKILQYISSPECMGADASMLNNINIKDIMRVIYGSGHSGLLKSYFSTLSGAFVFDYAHILVAYTAIKYGLEHNTLKLTPEELMLCKNDLKFLTGLLYYKGVLECIELQRSLAKNAIKVPNMPYKSFKPMFKIEDGRYVSKYSELRASDRRIMAFISRLNFDDNGTVLIGDYSPILYKTFYTNVVLCDNLRKIKNINPQYGLLLDGTNRHIESALMPDILRGMYPLNNYGKRCLVAYQSGEIMMRAKAHSTGAKPKVEFAYIEQMYETLRHHLDSQITDFFGTCAKNNIPEDKAYIQYASPTFVCYYIDKAYLKYFKAWRYNYSIRLTYDKLEPKLFQYGHIL